MDNNCLFSILQHFTDCQQHPIRPVPSFLSYHVGKVSITLSFYWHTNNGSSIDITLSPLSAIVDTAVVQPFRFSDLPREIRDLVYAHLVAKSYAIVASPNEPNEDCAKVIVEKDVRFGSLRDEVNVAIFRASRATMTEATRILYSKAIFNTVSAMAKNVETSYLIRSPRFGSPYN